MSRYIDSWYQAEYLKVKAELDVALAKLDVARNIIRAYFGITAEEVDDMLEFVDDPELEAGNCQVCGAKLQIVRPGSYQCPVCG
jgi:hypothetical protein